MKVLLFIITTLLIFYSCSAQNWSNVGNGVTHPHLGGTIQVQSMTEYNGNLYVGGGFDTAGSIFANSFAKWNGTNWDSVKSGPGTAGVRTMQVYKNELYVGGGKLLSKAIAKWNDTVWAPVGNGLNSSDNLGCGNYATAVFDNHLYAGGRFDSAGGVLAKRIAKFNGITWSSVPFIPDYDIYAFAVYNGELYIGGGFDSINNIPVNHIAKWNGANWSSLGTGVNSTVQTLAVYNGELFVGGSFNMVNGNSISGIAKWNGTNWSSIGSGLNNTVLTLAVYNGDLYAGGNFDSVAGIHYNNIARWDGVSWLTLGTGIRSYPFYSIVFSLATYNGDLYVGGRFDSAGTLAVNNIAKWNSIVGVQDIESTDHLAIFPNPCISSITIKNNAIGSFYLLFDVFGNILINDVICSNEFKLDLSNFSKGIYFLTIIQKSGAIHKKVLKE